MIDAILLDFYGTVVHEDDLIVEEICRTISRSSAFDATPEEIGQFWWESFSSAFKRSHGPDFRTQRVLELESLALTVERFGAGCDAEELCDPLFACWQRPSIFDDAIGFLDRLQVPVIVVSNIDRADIETAIAHHGLRFDRVVTSDDVRSYKPRPELFTSALEMVGCTPDRALHIGDSLTSDVEGANRFGIAVAWINRKGRPSPTASAGMTGPMPTYEATDLLELLAIDGLAI